MRSLSADTAAASSILGKRASYSDSLLEALDCLFDPFPSW